MKSYRLSFDTPKAEKTLATIIGLLFGIGLLVAGPMLAQDALAWYFNGMKSPAIVTDVRYFSRGYDIKYTYEDGMGISHNGSEHLMRWNPQIPRAGDTIQIRYTLPIGSRYLTFVDDALIPLVSFILGIFILLGIWKNRKPTH